MPALRSSVTTLTLLVGVAACAPDRLTSVSPAPSIPAADVAAAAAPNASAILTPTFLQPAAGAPTIANPVVRFWAKRGANVRRGIVDCQPSGLRFSADAPARLKVSFAEADADLNGDGRVNAADTLIAHIVTVWRRESAADPWGRVPSRVEVGAHEVEAEIGGFTGYAIAW